MNHFLFLIVFLREIHILTIGLCKVWMGMLAWGFVAIACATADAVAEATLVMSCMCLLLGSGGRHLIP